MQGGRDPFFGFGDPFGSFGGFGRQRSLISEVFGGRDPFDDPFFRSPFGDMFESSFFRSNGSPFMNPNNGGPFMNSRIGAPFMNPHAPGFLEHQPPQPNRSRGLVIEELNSDDEKDEKENEEAKKENPRKHGRSCKEPIVEDSDDEVIEKKSKHMARRSDKNEMQHMRMQQPQANTFTFQSSSVSYGGANGSFYTTSMTRRSGSDGLSYEEFREADSATRQATHRVSKGIHDKGHSVTRKLKSDGHVDTTQILHNLNQDELIGFEQAWNGNAKKHIPGLIQDSSSQDVMRSGRIGRRGSLALPCTENSNNVGNTKREVGGMAGPPQHSGRAKANVSSRVNSNRGSSSHQGNRHY